MTITYLSGRRIQGVSGDTKPTTNIQESSRFEETDTLKIYNYVASTTNDWILNGDAIPHIITRGVFGGGNTGSNTNVMDYITIDTTGNATDFGDLTVARQYVAGLSSNTRGVFGGGNDGAVSNVMDYITIASTGNATDFGDLTVIRSDMAGVSSGIRGVFGGGYTPNANSNVMDYITIDTLGNAIDFGDLTVARRYMLGGA